MRSELTDTYSVPKKKKKTEEGKDDQSLLKLKNSPKNRIDSGQDYFLMMWDFKESCHGAAVC